MKKSIIFFITIICALSQLQGQVLPNPNWHGWNEMAALVKNNGDGTFETIQEYHSNIAITIWTNAVFFDYNNDGNLDLLVVGKGGDWRDSGSNKYARLYRNLGKEGNYLFEEVYNTGIRQECDEMYFNTISVGDFDRDGYNDILIMSNDGSKRYVDLYKNNAGTGKFILQENAYAQAGHEVKEGDEVVNYFYGASNGAVMFGDLDNDGWLDIFYTGYSNVARGVRIYKNMQDGTFKDVTPINDVKGSFESQSVLGDVNGDGTLDIVVTGHGDSWSRHAEIYINKVQETGTPNYQLISESESGLIPVNKANILIADFNNDGRMDIITSGTHDGNKHRNRVYYQNDQGSFNMNTDEYEIFPTHDGGINMGDINGDGNMDVIIAGYKNNVPFDAYDSPVRIYENRPLDAKIASNQAPSAPQSVSSEWKDGKLKITWQPATDDITSEEALRYNIYVKYEVTGKIWMLIPADIETGKIKVGTDLQTSLSSHVTEYVMDFPTTETYTVGVQALDQSYAGGPFTTITKNATGIEIDYKRPEALVYAVDGGIFVKSEKSTEVIVYNATGSKIAKGQTNHIIPINDHGVYLVSTNDIVQKVIK